MLKHLTSKHIDLVSCAAHLMCLSKGCFTTTNFASGCSQVTAMNYYYYLLVPHEVALCTLPLQHSLTSHVQHFELLVSICKQ